MGFWSRISSKRILRRPPPELVQRLADFKQQLQHDKPLDVRQHAAHGLATMLNNREEASTLATFLQEAVDEVLANLVSLALHAEAIGSVVTLQLVLSCLGNYS